MPKRRILFTNIPSKLKRVDFKHFDEAVQNEVKEFGVGDLGDVSLPDLDAFGSEVDTESLLGIDEKCGSLPHEEVETLAAFLADYKSGAIPKPLKILPNVQGWEDLLEKLRPHHWSACAVRAMAKHFTVKGGAPLMHYLAAILLPRVRDDIGEYSRLNPHLGTTLKVCAYRKKEFFCGLILPWCSENMTTHEANVIGGFIAKQSFPVKFMAAAIHQILLRMEFSVPRIMVVSRFLSKNYNIPNALITDIVSFFLKFDDKAFARKYYTDHGSLPVIWYQTLLNLLTQYGQQTFPEERESLRSVVSKNRHAQLTPAIKMQLNNIEKLIS